MSNFISFKIKVIDLTVLAVEFFKETHLLKLARRILGEIRMIQMSLVQHQTVQFSSDKF